MHGQASHCALSRAISPSLWRHRIQAGRAAAYFLIIAVVASWRIAFSFVERSCYARIEIGSTTGCNTICCEASEAAKSKLDEACCCFYNSGFSSRWMECSEIFASDSFDFKREVNRIWLVGASETFSYRNISITTRCMFCFHSRSKANRKLVKGRAPDCYSCAAGNRWKERGSLCVGEGFGWAHAITPPIFVTHRHRSRDIHGW